LNEKALRDLEKEVQLRGMGLSSFEETQTGAPGFSGPAGGPSPYHTNYPSHAMPDDLAASLHAGA